MCKNDKTKTKESKSFWGKKTINSYEICNKLINKMLQSLTWKVNSLMLQIVEEALKWFLREVAEQGEFNAFNGFDMSTEV